MSGITGWAGTAVLWAHRAPGREEALFDVLFVVALALLCAAYGRGVQEVWQRRGPGSVIPGWRLAAFALGIAALPAALAGPVHELAERSFAGHMTQHMILLVVAGPLLAAGAVGLPLALAAPRRLRGRWARWRAGPTGTWLLRPGPGAVFAATAHSVLLWAWHLPVAYALADRSAAVHRVEHASFVVGSAVLWSLVLGHARRRVPAPVAVLLLLAVMLPAAALGAVLTLAPDPVYPTGILAPSGGDPIADQQLAGLIMWIPMDVAVLAAALAVFLRWLMRLDRSAPAHRDLRPLTVTDPAKERTR